MSLDESERNFMTEAKKKVYVETSVVSYLTAKPSHKEIDVMEELWQIKEELSSKFSSFREYCADLLKYQAERHPEFTSQHVDGAAMK